VSEKTPGTARISPEEFMRRMRRGFVPQTSAENSEEAYGQEKQNQRTKRKDTV
jgi:hypothetical protein